LPDAARPPLTADNPRSTADHDDMFGSAHRKSGPNPHDFAPRTDELRDDAISKSVRFVQRIIARD